MTPQEKIRQFVIMARHPEAKSYEEALEVDTINFENSICFDSVQNKICLYHQVKNIIKPQHIINLGRPITAFDVCWALNKKYAKKDYAPFYIYLDNFCYSNGDESHSSESLFDFETIKPDGTHTVLEDWDDEICEKMTKLINL